MWVNGHFRGESVKLILTDDVQLLEVLHLLLGNTKNRWTVRISQKQSETIRNNLKQPESVRISQDQSGSVRNSQKQS